MKQLNTYGGSLDRGDNLGFTLIELLTVISLMAILATIAGASWRTFINSQQLNAAIDQAARAMQEAKSNAIRDGVTWQASFREGKDEDGEPVTQWAVHKKSVSPDRAYWHNFNPNVRIVDPDIHLDDRNETTLYRYSSGDNKGVRRIQFNHHGNTNGQLGRLTLAYRHSDPNNNRRKLRCVIVSTLLGLWRKSNEQPTLDEGRYCY